MAMTRKATHQTGESRQPPAELLLVRDFVNTMYVEDGPYPELWSGGLGVWLVEHGLVDSQAELSETDLARARELRAAFRALLIANAGGPLNPAAIETLNQIGHVAPLQARFDPEGMAWIEPAAAGIDTALGRLLAIVVGAIERGSWSRLKVCRSRACRLAYYDASKNRSGAWCSMAICGNRNKVRAYQRRHAADRSGVVPESGPTTPASRLSTA
jgi:predicted RNA-binding Zn ribbon-like protein